MNQTESTQHATARVLMYSSGFCPHCVRAEMLLKSKGVSQIEKVRIDIDAERRAEMMARTGKRTVPQIYIGETYVGGADELFALNHAGKLDPLLAGWPASGR